MSEQYPPTSRRSRSAGNRRARSARRRVRVRQRRARARRHDRRKGESLAPGVAQVPARARRRLAARSSRHGLGKRAIERGRRDAARPPICGSSPASFRSRSVSTRSVVGRHCQRAATRRTAESRDAASAPTRTPAHQAAELASSCQSPVQATGSIAMRACRPTSSTTCVVAEIGDEHDGASAHDEQCTRAGEPRQVADVRQAGQEQPVQVEPHGEAAMRRGDAAAAVGRSTPERRP